MRGAGTLLLLAAWAVLSLPWERCVAACHEHVRPAGHAHEHACCGEHDHAHEHEGAPEHEHEPLRFESVSPSKPVFDAPLGLLTTVRIELSAPHAAPPAADAARDAGPAPGVGTVVLLL